MRVKINSIIKKIIYDKLCIIFLPFLQASLSSLASRRERVSFVIQKKRNEIADPETGYAFKFYKMGKWVTFKGLDKKS